MSSTFASRRTNEVLANSRPLIFSRGGGCRRREVIATEPRQVVRHKLISLTVPSRAFAPFSTHPLGLEPSIHPGIQTQAQSQGYVQINGGPVRQLYILRLVPTWVLSVCVCVSACPDTCADSQTAAVLDVGDEGCSSPALVVVVYVLGTCAYELHISMYIRRERVSYSVNVSPSLPLFLSNPNNNPDPTER